MPDTAAPAKTASKGPSPFLAQYLELKARHKDALLFFRMGDFYELFFDDAADAAEILGITLTARGEYQGAPIPMAGVPFHAAEGYLARLIRAGRRVAVCEQTESPADAKKRGSKSVVNREIVRVVTPGTLTEDSLLSEKSAQALIAVAFSKGGAESAVAACDVSTGAFDLFETPPEHLSERLSALPARELLFVDVDLDRPLVKAALEQISAPVTTRPASAARPQSGEALLKQIYNVAALDAFGEFSRCELAACALLLDYVQLTQAGAEIRLDPPLRGAPSNGLAIDPATRASLEIDTGSGGGRQGSLIATIDRTLTGPGARLLASRLSRPSTDAPEIKSRYDAIGFFKDDGDQRDDLRRTLSGAPDLERARSRLRLGRGGPRDLLAIAKALNAGETAAARLAGAIGPPPALIEMSARALTLTNAPDLAALAQDLKAAVDDESPLLARDGGFIRAGWDAALDEARGLQRDSRKIIAELQARYGQITGVSTLKIKHNNVLGYFIEVPARAAEPLLGAPLNQTFIHRQTLANAVRFSTEELAALAGRISRAEEEAKAREVSLFDAFVARLEAVNAPLAAAALAIAELDVAAANAEWSIDVNACRPELLESSAFDAKGLRHPVVEAALRKSGDGFTPNDLALEAGEGRDPRLLLITGPNMAGKSTYLRQAALAVILAQAGCFVPAQSLSLGLADRVFSRVGASDDLARGRSTFMVEMVETAAILTQAGPKSFVILDEVGRGTSTYDGLAIAWACVEHLHDQNRCRALFATHYHELSMLAEDLTHAANASLRAKDWKDGLVFLHDVQPGPADKSYGVQVAKLAGLPKRAVTRAAKVLKRLEADPASADALPLFAAASDNAAEPDAQTTDPLRELLGTIDPDTLTPRDALDLIYRLKAADD